jgi:hypothetical protein
VKIDHLRCILEAAYRGHVRKRIADLVSELPPRLTELHVFHEEDGSCCKLEPWPRTAPKVLAGAIARVSGKSEDDVEAILAEHEPSVIVMGGER